MTGSSWRGWGGVGAMAAACSLALAAALVPLRDSGGPVAAPPGGPLTQARYASTEAAQTCANGLPPELSLRPDSGTMDGPAVARIKKQGRLKVGVDQNSYLWGFRDPATGQLAGFDIDIAHAIAKDIFGDPNKVQFLTVPTSQRIQKIQNHDVDMVVRTMTINCDRIKDVAFSTAYFTAGQQVLAPKNSGIKGYDDTLRGKTVCTASGSTGEAELKGGPGSTGESGEQKFGLKVLTVPNQLDCLVRLQLGQADAVFTDNALAAGQAAQDPTVSLVGSAVTDEPYGVAMNLGDSDLVRRVNKVLADYAAGGLKSEWNKSYNRWLAADLPAAPGTTPGPPAPKYK
ncbi:glutamate ABC transporter substrate-binding protein [Streptomyces sp. CA-111067]|uniref:glutamate ABC transporter substrate-binding protein n=1 Tax=Streptomyces sp. CA-111067 TaxID=3240046 RepID=UPI003D979A13